MRLARTALAVLFLLSLLAALVRALWPGLGSFRNHSLVARKTVAVVEITGPVTWESGGGPFESSSGVKSWIEEIRAAASDPTVKGMLVRVNSPGGSVGASQELYQAFVRFRDTGKPLVVSVIDLCASGAYYAALPADAIVANRGSLVGSIGVIVSGAEFSKLLEKIGVTVNTIKSGPSKDVLSPARAMTDGERASLQAIVDSLYGQFVGDVVHWRTNRLTNVSDPEGVIRRIADGRVLDAGSALRFGLVDELGDGEDARETLAGYLGVTADDLDEKSFHPTGLWDRLGSVATAKGGLLGELLPGSSRSAAGVEWRWEPPRL